MTPFLTEAQRETVREAFQTQSVSVEQLILQLVADGHSPEDARALLIAEAKEYKKEMVAAVLDEQKQNERRKGMFIVIFLIALIGPVFHIQSILWYLVAATGAGIAGYFGFKNKPAAGIVAAVLATWIFPYAYSMYFEGRSSFIRIEMIIPMAMAAIPAIGVYYLISAIAYRDNE